MILFCLNFICAQLHNQIQIICQGLHGFFRAAGVTDKRAAPDGLPEFKPSYLALALLASQSLNKIDYGLAHEPFQYRA